MILHYLVIWLKDKDMRTREETPLDLHIDNRDEDDAAIRYESIIKAIAKDSRITTDRVSIVNICRL